MDEMKRKIIERGRQSILRIPERRRTYPGSTPRPFDRKAFASPLEYDRFLFTLGANEIPTFDGTDALSDAAIYLRPSPPHPSDSEDDSHQQTSFPRGARPLHPDSVWLTPYASGPRDQHTDETEREEGQQVDQQEGEAATSPAATPSPETALIGALGALQLPSGVSQLLASLENQDDSHQLNSVPGDAHPTDAGDVQSPPSSSLLRKPQSEKEGHEQEHKQEEEKAALTPDAALPPDVALPPDAVAPPVSAMRSAFMALQLPLDILQADFTHLAVQFVFENNANLHRFQGASDADYNERAIARTFFDFARVLWGTDAPGPGASIFGFLKKNLAHFFAVLRRHQYMRGGTTATPRELLIRLVGVKRVDGTWVDYHAEAELIDAYRDLRLTKVEDGRMQDFIDLAAAHAFEHYAAFVGESANLQGLGDAYDPEELAGTFYTFIRITLWDGVEDADHEYDARFAGLRRFFEALRARNYTRSSANTPTEYLARLVDTSAVPVDEPGPNPILSVLFANLDVSVYQPPDRLMRDGFQHAVTHIAFETINDLAKKPHRFFGPDVPRATPEVVTRITNAVVHRYAARLWPQVVERDPLPL
jgi:hypothetical protein